MAERGYKMKTKQMYNYERILEMVDYGLIDAEKMLEMFVNWHGLESLTDRFMKHIDDELE